MLTECEIFYSELRLEELVCGNGPVSKENERVPL